MQYRKLHFHCDFSSKCLHSLVYKVGTKFILFISEVLTYLPSNEKTYCRTKLSSNKSIYSTSSYYTQNRRTSAVWQHLYYARGYLISFQFLVKCQEVSHNKVGEWAKILLCIQDSQIQISGWKLNNQGVFMVFLSCIRKNAGIIWFTDQVITFPSISFPVHCSLISPSFINTQHQALKTSLNK